MSGPLDYLTVAGMVGSKALTYAVERQALVILAPDYLLIPEPTELPARLIEWTEHIGTLVHHGVHVRVYYVSDDFTEFALSMIGIEVPG